MTEDELREVAGLITFDEPLGPSNAEHLLDTPHAARLLFERQNEIYGQLSQRSGILVGRRGSGKTAFLNQLRLSHEDHVVQLAAPQVFAEILQAIQALFEGTPGFVEVTSDLWEVLLWGACFRLILRKSQSSKKVGLDSRAQSIRNFANHVGFTDESSATDVMVAILDFLQKQAAEKDIVFVSRQRIEGALRWGEEVSYLAALQASKELLTDGSLTKAPLLILMDTLENYQLDRSEAVLAVKGLMRFLGRQSANKRYFTIRFALPSELYDVFQRASENPDKDFANASMLSWRAGDLWRVAAHRLFLNFALYDPDRIGTLEAKHNVNERGGAISVFGDVLPTWIQNRLGIREPTLAYIMRHTQLLPRQLLSVLNAILRQAMDDKGKIGPVDNDMILTGVWDSERNITAGIEAAFRHKYPHFRDICFGSLPQMAKYCSDAELHSVFNRHVSGVIKRLRDEGNHVDLDFTSFRRMMIETGVIGKRIAETEVFIEALYEYSRPGTLVVSLEDTFCVHPLFSSAFPRPHGDGPPPKLVYPYGSDPSRERLVN